jgi:hypothetical protein
MEPTQEASVTLDIDREVPSSLESGGSDQVKEHPTAADGLLANEVTSAEEDLPVDSDCLPPLKAWDSSGPKVEEATDQKQSISTGVSDEVHSSVYQDLEKGKDETKTPLPPDSDSSSVESSFHKDVEKGNVEIKTFSPPDSDSDSDSGSASSTSQGSESGPHCRVCSESSAKGDVINLGCQCKLDLARVHRRCAEQWFRYRGIRRCEICGDIVQNVNVPLPTTVYVYVPRQQAVIQDPVTYNVSEVHPRRPVYSYPPRYLILRWKLLCLLWIPFCIGLGLFLWYYSIPVLKRYHSRKHG